MQVATLMVAAPIGGRGPSANFDITHKLARENIIFLFATHFPNHSELLAIPKHPRPR